MNSELMPSITCPSCGITTTLTRMPGNTPIPLYTFEPVGVVLGQLTVDMVSKPVMYCGHCKARHTDEAVDALREWSLREHQ